MKDIPTATGLIHNKFPGHNGVFVLRNIEEFMIEFAKLHVEAALKKASEEASNKVQPSDMEEWEHVPNIITSGDLKNHEDFWIEINKESIIKAYDLSLIK